MLHKGLPSYVRTINEQRWRGIRSFQLLHHHPRVAAAQGITEAITRSTNGQLSHTYGSRPKIRQASPLRAKLFPQAEPEVFRPAVAKSLKHEATDRMERLLSQTS
ncbi:MAG TPA: hypothetical protein VMV09_05875 [Candidatus Saccharimonadales bacterium]|nr:hypothetical protein [Candidatus Saccharimonadales bacterium]